MSNITSLKQQAADNFAAQFPILVQRGIDEPTWNALCNTIYPGANPDSVVMAIDYCKARGLDILLKPVHLVPMQVTDARTKEKVWRDVPMPGSACTGSRPIAPATTRGRRTRVRTGCHRGVSRPLQPERQDQGHLPQWCKYTVYKMVNGQRVAFHALERWKENYATQSGKTECPNAMWRKRPYAQLAKCTGRRRCARPGRRGRAHRRGDGGKEIIINEIPGPTAAWQSPAKSRALDAIRGQSTEPVTLGTSRWPNPPRRTTPTPTPTTAPPSRGSDTTEWQQAYTTAWTWASETGDRTSSKGIKQIAGERKRNSSAPSKPTHKARTLRAFSILGTPP